MKKDGGIIEESSMNNISDEKQININIEETKQGENIAELPTKRNFRENREDMKTYDDHGLVVLDLDSEQGELLGRHQFGRRQSENSADSDDVLRQGSRSLNGPPPGKQNKLWTTAGPKKVQPLLLNNKNADKSGLAIDPLDYPKTYSNISPSEPASIDHVSELPSPSILTQEQIGSEKSLIKQLHWLTS